MFKRQPPSPEIPSPVKTIQSDTMADDDIENKAPIGDMNAQSSTITSNSEHDDINPISILLANGQPLLTNFEEKYLVDLILKTLNKDIEAILHDKIHVILEMNYGSKSSLFKLDQHWIFDFILKHFHSLVEHVNSTELFEKFLNKNIDKNNSKLVSKHWQLKTLVNEHTKQRQQTPVSQKRRMTIRRIGPN